MGEDRGEASRRRPSSFIISDDQWSQIRKDALRQALCSYGPALELLVR